MQTYLDTQRDLSALLEEASRAGAIRIRRSDGETFLLKAEKVRSSPLDVPGIKLAISTEEIVNFVRKGRERY